MIVAQLQEKQGCLKSKEENGRLVVSSTASTEVLADWAPLETLTDQESVRMVVVTFLPNELQYLLGKGEQQ